MNTLLTFVHFSDEYEPDVNVEYEYITNSGDHRGKLPDYVEIKSIRKTTGENITDIVPDEEYERIETECEEDELKSWHRGAYGELIKDEPINED